MPTPKAKPVSGGNATKAEDKKTCLVILGMHRSGTSALTRVCNLLGYGLPDRLIGALDGNEAGHWEPENIVLFNDRLLGSMQSTWYDFRNLASMPMSPAETLKAESQLTDLLDHEYGGQPQIILKDPRICRIAPLYIAAVKNLGYRAIPVIAFRNPAEVTRSLQNRRQNWPEGLGTSHAALMWLSHVLEAEYATRGMARSFCSYDALMKDWQSAMLRIAKQGGFEFPESISETAPIVEEFLRPQLRHEFDRGVGISGQPALRGWVHRAYDALRRLEATPDSATAQAVLDKIRIAFNMAELPLNDLSEGSAREIRSILSELRTRSEENQNQRELLKAANTSIAALEQELQQTADASLHEREESAKRLASAHEELNSARLNIASQEQKLHALEQQYQQEREETAERLTSAHEALDAARLNISTQEQKFHDLDQQHQQEREETVKRLTSVHEELNAALLHISSQERQLHDLRLQHKQVVDATLQEREETAKRLIWQENKIAELNSLFHDRNLTIDHLELVLGQHQSAFLSSRSWRVTAPLRVISGKLRLLRNVGRTFRRGSAAKGGYIAGSKTAVRILAKEGISGLSQRMTTSQLVIPQAESNGSAWHSAPNNCFIAATPHVMSLARLMERVLIEEGFRVTVRTDLVGAEYAGHVFVICPQMFENLPAHYVAVQMEQSVSSRWFTPEYFERLNSARAVIDYSIKNIDFLREHEVPLYKLYYVPLDADPRLLAVEGQPRKGILFYGDDKCTRRQRILSAVAATYPQLKIVNNVFGEELENELRNAAVVLNVHYYEGALLETTRIYQALSYGTPVVSEMSIDQIEHQTLNGVVDFAPLDDVERLIELLRPYAEDTETAKQKRQNISDYVSRTENRFEMYFRRFLLAQQMIGYDAFTTRAPSYPGEIGEYPNYCLSLPETPDRRALFETQGKEMFTIWSGLKAVPGWIGAAMSYRHMFEHLTKTGTQRAIICEDDVLFPEDYENRLATIQRYLDGQEWDVFSGFLADAHSDLKILNVEEFEGQTFVHIDRTVSMVFNIYNRGIMEFLSKWDPTNHDVHSNTIDRYLENHGDTRVILTLPFLVGHRPDATSTIWGFENTQYDEVVNKSEKRLAEKVAEFLKKRKYNL